MIEDKSILAYSGLTYYDERIKDYIDNTVGGSALHPGSHILIDSANTISAVYDSSDFDISRLTDSHNLRETWSNKQDALSAGTGIIIDANNVISVNEDEIAEIDDTVTSVKKTWSSNRIGSELDNKSNTGHTHVMSDISGLSEEFENYYTTGETYTKTEVDNLIGAIDQFRYEIYATLSAITNPQSNVLYLIGPSGTGSDKYEEYVYANSTFTKIGDTTIDLSGYATTTALTDGLAGKSNTGHTHDQYSLTSHTHTVSDVTDLQNALDGKSNTGHTHDQYSLTGHTHEQYSLTSHTHTISDISDLQDTLDSKSNTGHTHDQYSLTSHTHSEYSLTSHTHTAAEVGALPDDTVIPSKTSDLTNDSGFITGFTETDPTVPAWAKDENKPTYDVSEISGLTEELACKSDTGHTHEQYSLTSHTHTAEEVGALPDDTVIPSKTSDLTNDSGFVSIDDSNVSTGTTYSSNKIIELIGDISSFDVQVVDELPVTGDSHTIYFVPSNKSSLTPEPSMNLLTYNNKHGVTTVDFENPKGGQVLTGLTVGDVFKYVEDGSGSQTPQYVNFSVAATIDESGSTIYSIDSQLQDFALYNIGDTFRVVSADTNSVAFTSVSNPSIDEEIGFSGITGHIALENNKIYRLTGYYSSEYPEIWEQYFHSEIEGVYLATYEEVNDIVTPDYEVENIGGMQIRTIQRQFVVPSAIDKENFMLSFIMETQGGIVNFHFNSGVTSTITLQDGHYYQLKDYYIVKGTQLSGKNALYLALTNYGFVVCVYDEVENPTMVKYDDITYVPGGQILENYEYPKYPKYFLEVYSVEEEDPETHEITTLYCPDESNAFYGDSFPQIKVGEIIKVTGENTGFNGNPYVVISDVNDGTLLFNSGIIASGITNASAWAKDEYYKCTGFHKCMAPDSDNGFEIFVPTFEKVTSALTADYEFENMVGISYTKESKSSIMDEYMWVDDDWELIGNTEVDLTQYYTKDETNSLLNGKSNTGHTHPEYTTETEFESATYAFSSHINELTERIDANDEVQDITVEDVIAELNIIDNN